MTSVLNFLEWRKCNGYASFDQYNFWSTEYGIWSKRLYYKYNYLSLPFIAPIFIADIFCPGSRKLFSKKKRFPIADAHFILAYLNLYKYTSDKRYLQMAKQVAEDLLQSAIKGYSGLCWGYPFNWMTTRGLWKTGVPLITTTSYCFEAYLKLYEITNDEKFIEIAHSIFLFTLNDLKDTPLEENLASSSYSPIDNSQIVNSNAYRSYVLVEGAHRFQNESAFAKAKANINFILKNQQCDGSWLYAINDKKDHFVDNFHTCFVLKNLLKANLILNDERILQAIIKGFEFYKSYLLQPDLSPLPFAKVSRLNIVRTELYDYAEGISLCLHLKNLDMDATIIAQKMVKDVITKYQNKNGSFTTRVNIFNISNNVPYLRWPQSQLFYAMTNYLIHCN